MYASTMQDSNQLKVVSLLPSATDIIAVAGGVHLLVGRSHECNWPSDVEKLPILTGAVNEFVSSKQMDDVVKGSLARGEGLYYLEQERLTSLGPDVIVTQDLCNVCSVDLALVEKTVAHFSIKPRIVTLNPQKLSDVLADIERVGTAIGKQQHSQETVAALKTRVQKAQAAASSALQGQNDVKVAFVEWLDPLFIGGHWTPEMIKMAGGVHPLNLPIGDGGAGPSIRISNQALVDADCDWIIVCPCGFTIEDTRKEEDLLNSKSWWQGLRAVKEGRVAIVDGNQMFARPGPRLVDALEFLVGLLHNRHDLIPQDFPWTWWDTKRASSAKTFKSTATEASQPSQAASNSVPACNGVSAHPQGASHNDKIAVCVQNRLGSSSDNQDAAHAECAGILHKDAESTVPLSVQQGKKQAQQPAQSASEAQQTQLGTPHAQHEAQQAQHKHQQAKQDSMQSQQIGTPSLQTMQAPQSKERKWRAAPYLGPEIEDAHATAIAAGHD